MKSASTTLFRLDGKRALVTGASSGIGREAAFALASAGADITCVARRQEPLDAVVSELISEGASARAVACDISDLEAQAHLFDEAPFDVVLNAAGIARHGPSMDTSATDFDAVMALNLRGAYFLSQHAARALEQAELGGSIIHISSQMGHVGGPDRAVYCASKHALEGMTKAMALEWGRLGIRVNTIAPTFIRTQLTEQTFADPERRAWMHSRIALGRIGQAKDVVGAIVYLASEASCLVTGTSLRVDGGWTAA